VLLAFLLVLTVGSMWESRSHRVSRALPLLALSTSVAALLFGVSRLV
jgi:hypothetical protein